LIEGCSYIDQPLLCWKERSAEFRPQERRQENLPYLKPDMWMIFICFAMVDFPDSPAPEGETRVSSDAKFQETSMFIATDSLPLPLSRSSLSYQEPQRDNSSED